MEGESPGTQKPACLGRAHVPGCPGKRSRFGDLILPENPADRKSKVTTFDNGGAMRTPLWRVLT
jgi:hypothetical protein